MINGEFDVAPEATSSSSSSNGEPSPPENPASAVKEECEPVQGSDSIEFFLA